MLQFDRERGYGFVAADDGGEDVFLHSSVFDGDPYELAPGIRVEFKIMEGDRGRKAFAAHLVPDGSGSDGPGSGDGPAPSPHAVKQPVSRDPAENHAPDDEQMCDVLSPTELGQELTELMLASVPTLTGQQITEVRQSMLDCARKHGWIDI
ncbi:MAG: cold shock domain-containing protein [Nocardiopsaceae bacterium]|nr:cold shock domain-containing protein [Nocardiopsaceae bacterium]